jgi:4'-phosphopantetheinyl transferase
MQAFEVQVWSASVADTPVGSWAELHSLLDPDEAARAQRFRFDLDRQTYVLAHALRRLALGEYLETDPAKLMFGETPQGRPELKLPSTGAYGRVFFSHSHSQGQVAFSLSSEAPVGIDIEAIDDCAVDLGLLDAFLIIPEPDAATDGYKFPEQFFFYWTALEAFWKAEGSGLATGNPKIQCRMNSSGVHEIHVAGTPANRPVGCVLPLITAPGHAMSLAVGYPPKSIKVAATGQSKSGTPARIAAREKTHFFGCKRRLLRCSQTTIVSS